MICKQCKEAADINQQPDFHCHKEGTFCTCQHRPITYMGLNVFGFGFSS